jgi:Xaa-Pro dipeptidase
VNAERRGRALAAMADASVDALVLGREANARYVSGARRLWLAGTRAFAPGCVLVAATGDVHLLSSSDDGVPVDVPDEHLYPITWNPANLMARLAVIPGLAAARRVGVDGLTPFMESLLGGTFPNAEWVDGQSVMLAARQWKLSEEVEAIRGAIAVATEALDAVIATARPGVSERELLARFHQRMCELGTTTPAFEGTFGHAFPSDRVLDAGDRVLLDAGVLVDGYEGGLARTIVCGGPQPDRNPADELFTTLLGAVKPGATGAQLWAAWDATGTARPTQAVAHGVGLGLEPPVVGDDDVTFTPGMTISLRAEADGWVRRDTAVVTDAGAQLLAADTRGTTSSTTRLT